MKKKSAKKSGTPTKRRKAVRSNRKKPHVATAVICERVLREANAASLIRIVDTYTLEGPTRQLKPGVLGFNMFIVFKSGDAIGKRQVRVIVHSPAGEEAEVINKPIELKGGEHGASLHITSRLTIKEQGLYWFDVFVNRDLMTRIPLRIRYRQEKSE